MRQLKLNGKQENANNSPGCISSNDIRQGARLWEAIIGTFLHQKVGKWLSTFCIQNSGESWITIRSFKIVKVGNTSTLNFFVVKLFCGT